MASAMAILTDPMIGLIDGAAEMSREDGTDWLIPCESKSLADEIREYVDRVHPDVKFYLEWMPDESGGDPLGNRILRLLFDQPGQPNDEMWDSRAVASAIGEPLPRVVACLVGLHEDGKVRGVLDNRAWPRRRVIWCMSRQWSPGDQNPPWPQHRRASIELCQALALRRAELNLATSV